MTVKTVLQQQHESC